jgi:hypothetical protein
MTAWLTIDPNGLIPRKLSNAVSALGDVLSASTALAKNPLDGFASLQTSGVTDPVTAVVNGILDTLSDILRGGRLHMLAIPIAKTIPGKSPPPLPATLQDLETRLAVRLGPTTTSANLAYADMIAGTGGNAGFYQTFATSMNDPQDPNRPQYVGQSDAVFMTVLLVGAPRLAAIIAAATTLNMLTRPIGDNDLTARVVPVPQNLSAKIVGTSAGVGVGVTLEWDAPLAENAPRYFPGVSIRVQRYAVIRTTDRKASQATAVLDLFNTATLTEGLTFGQNKVLKIGTGKNTTYLDTSTSSDKAPVYYFVAWECVVTEQAQDKTLAFNRLSNVAKVTVVAPPPRATGRTASWKATPSALDAFPGMRDATQRLVEQSRILLKTKLSPLKRINAAVTLSQVSAKRLNARSADLIADVQRLAAALATPIPRIYITQMTSSKGGNGFLLAELASRLGDTTDTSRPPFDNGEYVCGVCFVAGAPRIADLSKVISFFAALFGAPTPSNPLLGILDSIDTLVTQAEIAVFQPNMTPFPPGAGVTGIDPTTGVAYPPAQPVTGTSGTPVDTASPENPNAGDTNNVPLAELC